MLDRATSCLKSGAARYSMRSAHKSGSASQFKSRRYLHSAFWNHGAGALNLPPWPMSMLPRPDDLPFGVQHEGNSVPKKSKSHEDGTTGLIEAPAPEGHFSDFLYPPQALAWIGRASKQHPQPRGQRNARRMPDGFIVVSRSFASGSRISKDNPSRPATLQEGGRAADGPTPPDGEQSQRLATWRPSERSDAAAEQPYAEPYADSAMELAHQPDQVSKIFASGSHISKDNPSGGAATLQEGIGPGRTADGPTPPDKEQSQRLATWRPSERSDAAAEQPSAVPYADPAMQLAHLPGDRISRLLALIDPSSVAYDEDAPDYRVSEAWQIFQSLDETQQKDEELRYRLLTLLVTSSADTAYLHFSTLYQSFKTSEKTAEVYHTILNGFLRRARYEHALEIHRESLKTMPENSQATRVFLRHCVKNNLLQLMMQLVSQWREIQHEAGRPSRPDDFWLAASNDERMFKLVRGLLQSENFNCHFKSHFTTLDKDTRQLIVYLLGTALRAKYLRSTRSFSVTAQSGRIERNPMSHLLFRRLARLGTFGVLFIENFLIALLNDRRFEFGRILPLVSEAYPLYQRVGRRRPSRKMFLTLLTKLTEHESSANISQRKPSSLTVQLLVRHWQKHHGNLKKYAIAHLLSFYAASGNVDATKKWMIYHRRVYPAFHDYKDSLWTLIYVHARRRDLPAAQQTFMELQNEASEHGERLSLRCWNILLQAHNKTDDLTGALACFREMDQRAELRLDAYSSDAVMKLLADRGYIQDVETMLDHYERTTGESRDAKLVKWLIVAHIRNGNTSQAQEILRDLIPRTRFLGALADCFNALLAEHAHRRQFVEFMDTWRWMKDQNITPNAASFASAISLFMTFRQFGDAQEIIHRAMDVAEIKPSTTHFRVIIHGAVAMGHPTLAFKMYHDMLRRNIKPNFSIHQAYLRARALMYDVQDSRLDAVLLGENELLPDAVEDLTQRIPEASDKVMASKTARLRWGSDLSPEAYLDSYFDHLIDLLGKRGFTEQALEMFEKWKDRRGGAHDEVIPIRLLTALMSVYLRAGSYDKVEWCWKLAKAKADRFVGLAAAPSPTPPGWTKAVAETAALESSTSETPTDTIFSIESLAEKTPAVAPARGFILCRSLGYYMTALQYQNRAYDLAAVFSQANSQGYLLDNGVLNHGISLLCRCRPPLALLAFRMTETHLIANFPGWRRSSRPPSPQEHDEGLQFMQKGYYPHVTPVPQYPLLVQLGGLLREMGRASWVQATHEDMDPRLRGYVGSLQMVRQQAPKTLDVVWTIPRRGDNAQRQFLRPLEAEG